MNLPEGTYLAYYVHHEAWNAGQPGSVKGRTITIEARRGQLAPWKASVTERDGIIVTAGSRGTAPVGTVLPELAGALECAHSLDDVRAALDMLGAKDETDRRPR